MNESRISYSALIGICIILGGLAISIFLSSSSLPLGSNIFAYFLIAIMFFIVVWISPIWVNFLEYLDKRRRNKLAEKYFEQFKHENFVNNFEKITSTRSDYVYFNCNFYDTLRTLKQNQSEFNQISDPKINIVRDRFTFWRRWYGYFDGKIDHNSFSTLLEDFHSTVHLWYQICIYEPLVEISRIKKEGIVINEDRIKEWNIALKNYDYFQKKYNHFVDQVNEEFNEELLQGLPSGKEL